MKKILFFLPALVFAIFLLYVSFKMSIGSISLDTLFIEISLILSGVLLSRNIFLGGLIGILPAIYLMFQAKNTYTGVELPIGIILFVYYAICSFMVYKKNLPTANDRLL